MARLLLVAMLGVVFPLGLAAGPLHTAVRGGDSDAAAALIAAGADVDELEATGEAPLHVAANLGEVDIARLLIASGSRSVCW